MCKNNYLEEAKKLQYINPKLDIIDRDNLAFIASCENGHLELAQWLHNIKTTMPIYKKYWKFLKRLSRYTYDEMEPILTSFVKSCENGHIEVAKWVYNIDKRIFDWRTLHEAFKTSCDNGHITIAKWILTLNPKQNKNILENSKYIFKDACHVSGNVEIAKFILEVNPDIEISSNEEFIFRGVCKNGHLEIAMWLINLKPDIDITTYSNYAFREACNNKHSKVTEWFLKIHPNMTIDLYEYAFRCYCFNNNLELAKYILELNPDINIQKNDNMIFIVTCSYGHLEVAKWLLKLINPTMNDFYYINKGFINACLQGKLLVAEWLVSLVSNYDILEFEKAFESACENGHLEVAQWLIKVKPNINISARDEYSFRFACKNNHLEVAQWLLFFKPDINIFIRKHEAFTDACNMGNLEMALWFQTLYPNRYKITSYNHLYLGDFSFSLTQMEIKYQILDQEDIVINRCEKVTELEQCPICWESFANVKSICNHSYCKECIENWFLSEHDKCPICRKIIKQNEFIRLELENK
jgi:ankyrin repeat protein